MLRKPITEGVCPIKPKGSMPERSDQSFVLFDHTMRLLQLSAKRLRAPLSKLRILALRGKPIERPSENMI